MPVYLLDKAKRTAAGQRIADAADLAGEFVRKVTRLANGNLEVVSQDSSDAINTDELEVSVDLSGKADTDLQDIDTDLTGSEKTTVLNRIGATAAIDAAIDDLVGGAPGALNTLNELAAALDDDAAFSTTVTNSLANKIGSSGVEPAIRGLGSPSNGSKYLFEMSGGSLSLVESPFELYESESGFLRYLIQNVSTTTEINGSTQWTVPEAGTYSLAAFITPFTSTAIGIRITVNGSGDNSNPTTPLSGLLQRTGGVVVLSANDVIRLNALASASQLDPRRYTAIGLAIRKIG